MAKAKVIHSGDACMIEMRRSRTRPEPSTSVIKFPGGNVEVTRTTDNQYWVHLAINEGAEVHDSRIDYNFISNRIHGILDIPDHKNVRKIALKIAGKFDNAGE